MIQMKVNEATAAKRRMYFDLRDATDGITPELSEATGQPQISINGAAWTNTGIGTLTHIGNGRYYAALDAGVGAAGDVIDGRYKSSNTAETPARESFFVVNYDPADIPLAVDTRLTSQHGSGSWQQVVTVAGTVVLPGQSVNSDLELSAACGWTQAFSVSGWDPTSWTQYVLTIKADGDADEDDAALLAVRVSATPAGTDGMIRFRGAAIASGTNSNATLVIDTSIPNTVKVTVTADANAMNLPPSPTSKQYVYEINEWKGAAGTKRRLWYGKLKLNRTVRRSATAP